MTRRQYLTPSEKRAMLEKQGWKCACSNKCSQPLWPGAPVRYDHRPPLALGGTAKPNQAVTPHCHDRLTKTDLAQIAKSNRQRKAHLGLKKRKNPGFQKRPPGFKYAWPKRPMSKS
jgi:hypothetical protein